WGAILPRSGYSGNPLLVPWLAPVGYPSRRDPPGVASVDGPIKVWTRQSVILELGANEVLARTQRRRTRHGRHLRVRRMRRRGGGACAGNLDSDSVITSGRCRIARSCVRKAPPNARRGKDVAARLVHGKPFSQDVVKHVLQLVIDAAAEPSLDILLRLVVRRLMQEILH